MLPGEPVQTIANLSHPIRSFWSRQPELQEVMNTTMVNLGKHPDALLLDKLTDER
jgi:hypothetical protein